jgi:tRNA(Arg) A34 adenosine deaminase TadA
MDDTEAMERCIELAALSARAGDHPFGALILLDGKMLAEGENRVITDMDPTGHAEVTAIRRACRTLGRHDLSGSVLYTSAEPCVMCATAIRLTAISRVVFAAPSSGDYGGYSSAYGIMRDGTISRFPPPPEVVAGFLADQSEALWKAVGWPRRPASSSPS